MLAGQAQKEFFVNQALVILDAIVSGTIVASLPEAPASPSEGDCYRVASPATDPIADAWGLHPNHIAVMAWGSWHFVAPAEGMLFYDHTKAQWLYFRSGWTSENSPAAVSGGEVVDIEA